MTIDAKMRLEHRKIGYDEVKSYLPVENRLYMGLSALITGLIGSSLA